MGVQLRSDHDRAVSTKAGWDRPAVTADEAISPFVLQAVLPLAAEAIIYRASRLTADEIDTLDVADRSRQQARVVAWDLLRYALDGDPALRNRRMAARHRAWDAVNRAASSAGLETVLDDGYWRVVYQPAAGAARLARFAACALLAPQRVDEDITHVLLEPWRRSIG
jgi:hypothetical protein